MYLFSKEFFYKKIQNIVFSISIIIIFAFDTLTEYEIAAAVFYSAVILWLLPRFSRRKIMAVTGLCMLLTVLSLALTVSGDYYAGLINTLISLLAIIMTAWLGLKAKAAQAAAQQAQNQLLHMSRITTIGQLTTSIAHEINQPLAAIMLRAQTAQRWLAQHKPDKALQALTGIQNDAQRSAQIIEQIRSMVRGHTPQARAFDLNQTVHEVLKLAWANLTQQNIVVELKLAPDLPLAWGEPLHYQQILGNLLLNAMDALAGNCNARQCIEITTQANDQSSLLLSVADSGSGLSEAANAHLFEAFWSAKPEGLGLGLTICRHLAESNSGRIWANKRADGKNGAVFYVSLPCVKHNESS